VLKTDGTLQFGIGKRQYRQISITKDGKQWIPSLFQLSTGEALLFNLFFTIIRDFDLTNVPIQGLSDVKGIVVIDEVDAHLHTAMQYEALPELLALLPGVQFVLTSHSPLFLLGVERALGRDGCTILEMPSGNQVSAERFSEFENLYRIIQDTEKFEKDLKESLAAAQKPIVFVEGDYDIRYLNRAAELFGRGALLNRFSFRDGGGFGNLNKVWKSLQSEVCGALTTRVLLLYDCDIAKTPETAEKVVKLVMPFQADNPIKKGIENLLPAATISKLEGQSRRFIDYEPARPQRLRGEDRMIPEVSSVNPDEKRKVCDWLCENGEKADFAGMNPVLDQIEEWLSS